MCKVKYCRSCQKDKSVEEFNKDSYRKDGLKSRCKECDKNRVKLVKIYSGETKVCKACFLSKPIEEYGTISWLAKKSAKCKACDRSKILILKPIDSGYKSCYFCKKLKLVEEFHKNKASRTGYSSICKLCVKLEREVKREQVRAWNNNYYSNRRKIDPVFKLRCDLRNLIKGTFKKGVNNYIKSDTTENILGCTIEFFINYIQSLFTEGMTLENHGQCEECWHFDHIIPISSAKTEEEVIKLNHYTNFQPLWSRENLSKGNKY